MQTSKKTPFKGIHYMTFMKSYKMNVIAPDPKRITEMDDSEILILRPQILLSLDMSSKSCRFEIFIASLMIFDLV